MAKETQKTDGGSPTEEPNDDERATGTPRAEQAPTARDIDASAPPTFGLVQVWWGDGKGKTTAALGMGFRAAGHGYRVHLLQFMKGGTASVEDVRGEYNAIAAVPGISVENRGQYGWHGLGNGSDDEEHTASARAGLERAKTLLDASSDVDGPVALDGAPTAGVHMLVLDEVLYAVEQGLLDPEAVVDLVERKPEDLELVLTGGHERPTYLDGHVDLQSHVQKERHPIDDGQPARKGTEY
ncbi:ATP:corrinoid adenosyltransferase [Halanaeroarchaeum sp. HSR-CO]|uniref:cob(I)yrinic acid a,c-diamide adenosyltransferase n=1 Tax=Halanaeroarchaeum sp. HSR-CO TaxID=2866382 RepID=UPI00217D9F52|nr:cob(I)yrinic acid a,c-diamide adenosyltransferase [Halanaeroarchaeum sp. HSR-CO]UWG46790.1 ATP:corrinoid adenosyltransferase [Halanaeroarchaeum sp. HSR-CO]